MSAFLCNDKHFQVLADAMADAATNKHHKFNWITYRLFETMFKNTEPHRASIEDLESMAISAANRFHYLNQLALMGRYGDTPENREPVTKRTGSSIHMSSEQVYKYFKCLRYQCSEYIADQLDDYKALSDYIGGMAEAIVDYSDKYDNGNWEVPADEQLPESFSVLDMIRKEEHHDL